MCAEGKDLLLCPFHKRDSSSSKCSSCCCGKVSLNDISLEYIYKEPPVLVLCLQLIRACIIALACCIGWKVVGFHLRDRIFSLAMLLLRLLQLRLLGLLVQMLQPLFSRCSSCCAMWCFYATCRCPAPMQQQQQHQKVWQQLHQQLREKQKQ